MEPRRCKKKLTSVELFAHRLCLALGVPHPDYLPLSWEQFHDWQRYSNQEPWGEERADQRTLALAAWIKARIEWDGELPDLLYPYFETGENLMRQKAVLDKRVEEIKAKRKAQRDILAGG